MESDNEIKPSNFTAILCYELYLLTLTPRMNIQLSTTMTEIYGQ